MDSDALGHLPHALGRAGGARGRHQLRRGGDDGAAGAVVALQHDLPRRREILTEAVETSRIRAAEAVDRLVGIADNAEIAVGGTQQPQHSVLLGIYVLELVDRYEAEALAACRGNVGAG